MAFLNVNDFIVELSEEELVEVNGTGGCSVCGAAALPVITVPTIGACGSCGYGAFNTGPYIEACSTQSANTLSYNTNYASTNSSKNSRFTMIN